MFKKLHLYFSNLHKSRFECLQLIIEGMIDASCVQISRIATKFYSMAQDSSIQKRIYRFLSEVDLNEIKIAQFCETLAKRTTVYEALKPQVRDKKR